MSRPLPCGGAERTTRGRGRRALTVIELMVAIAVALALAAVVLPMAASRVREAGVAEIGERLGAAAVMAGVEAQRRGKVLELVARGDGREGLELMLRAFAEHETESGRAGAAEAGWVDPEPLAVLPAGIRLVTDKRAGEREPGGATAIVAVVLPDGTFEGPEPALVLEDGEGRRVEVRLSRWDGRVTVSPAPRDGDAGGPEPARPDAGGAL